MVVALLMAFFGALGQPGIACYQAYGDADGVCLRQTENGRFFAWRADWF